MLLERVSGEAEGSNVDNLLPPDMKKEGMAFVEADRIGTGAGAGVNMVEGAEAIGGEEESAVTEV